MRSPVAVPLLRASERYSILGTNFAVEVNGHVVNWMPADLQLHVAEDSLAAQCSTLGPPRDRRWTQICTHSM